MTKITRNPDTIAAPVAAYVHQIEISNPRKRLLISGQIGTNIDGSIPQNTELQFANALHNVRNNLETAGMEPHDIVKLTVYLVDEVAAEFRAQAFHQLFGDYKPCMTLLYVKALASSVLKVEIEAEACQF